MVKKNDMASLKSDLAKNKNKRKRSSIYFSESGSDSDDSSKNSKKILKRDYVSSDGHDDQLMGDEKVKARLASLTAKDRETESFRGSKQREGRIEVAKKLRQATEVQGAKDKLSKPKGKNNEVASTRKRIKEKVKSSASKTFTYVPTRQDLNLIRLSRHKLEQFVNMPFFDRIAKGCYVKVGIGECNNATIYKVAEVIGVYETTKIYDLGNTRTNKGLKVRYGNQERWFRMEFVSNQEFSDLEYHEWIKASAAAGNDLPTKSKIDQKQADIIEAISYESTYANNHNSQKNVEEMEKASMAELPASGGKKIEDPFTRKPTRPRMDFGAGRKEVRDAALSKADTKLKQPEAPQLPDNANKPAQGAAQVSQGDLFSAQNFDMKIDFEVSLAATPVDIVTKSETQGVATKRRLTLQEYKKRRGLI